GVRVRVDPGRPGIEARPGVELTGRADDRSATQAESRTRLATTPADVARGRLDVVLPDRLVGEGERVGGKPEGRAPRKRGPGAPHTAEGQDGQEQADAENHPALRYTFATKAGSVPSCERFPPR